jgi:hypothetical protein
LVDEVDMSLIEVREVSEDTRYFSYRAFDYHHYSFTAQPDKARRRLLLDELVGLEDRPSRRISYLYCPIRARPQDGSGHPEIDDAAVRIGFAVVHESRADTDHLELRLAETAQRCGYRLFKTRSVADGTGVGLDYRWDVGDDKTPHVLLSAGPDGSGGLRTALDLIGDTDGVRLEGGTALIERSYTCRAFRYWATDDEQDAIERRVADQRTRELAGDPTFWSIQSPSAAGRPTPDRQEGEPEWLISWIRWRLELGSETGVARLLGVLDEWVASTESQSDWTVTFSNIEFLANRLVDDRLVVGKARYRLGLKIHRSEGRSDREWERYKADLAAEVNQSLEVTLRAGVAELLKRPRRYIVVEKTEPQNPLTISSDTIQ